MKQFLIQLRAISPADILAALEQGAEWIHELPYRFAAWLPKAPGQFRRTAQFAWRWFCGTETVQEVLAVYGWLERKADEIHALPYRFAAWLPTVPERWRRMWQRIFAWMEKKDITPRIKIMAPLCLAALILPFCIQRVEKEELTYLLTYGAEPEFIAGYPDTDRELGGMSIYTGDSSRDAQLVLREGQTVSVRADGQTHTTVSRHETVANLLRRLELEVDKDEMVVLDISSQTPSIAIRRVYYYDWQQDIPLAYETEYVKDPLMKKGEEEEVQAGSMGNLQQTYRNLYREGRLSATELVNEVVTEPVTQIIEQGTRVQEVSRDDRIEKVVYNADGSGYLLFKSGDTMTFRERVTCSATAYSIGSWTASGLPTKVGHIAVDPKVFPYHTRFYIYTNDGYLVYGNAVAADCGSAIKGYKIDLWFETFDEACWFGRRDCTVFVLN